MLEMMSMLKLYHNDICIILLTAALTYNRKNNKEMPIDVAGVDLSQKSFLFHAINIVEIFELHLSMYLKSRETSQSFLPPPII